MMSHHRWDAGARGLRFVTCLGSTCMHVFAVAFYEVHGHGICIDLEAGQTAEALGMGCPRFSLSIIADSKQQDPGRGSLRVPACLASAAECSDTQALTRIFGQNFSVTSPNGDYTYTVIFGPGGTVYEADNKSPSNAPYFLGTYVGWSASMNAVLFNNGETRWCGIKREVVVWLDYGSTVNASVTEPSKQARPNPKNRSYTNLTDVATA